MAENRSHGFDVTPHPVAEDESSLSQGAAPVPTAAEITAMKPPSLLAPPRAQFVKEHVRVETMRFRQMAGEVFQAKVPVARLGILEAGEKSPIVEEVDAVSVSYLREVVAKALPTRPPEAILQFLRPRTGACIPSAAAAPIFDNDPEELVPHDLEDLTNPDSTTTETSLEDPLSLYARVQVIESSTSQRAVSPFAFIFEHFVIFHRTTHFHGEEPEARHQFRYEQLRARFCQIYLRLDRLPLFDADNAEQAAHFVVVLEGAGNFPRLGDENIGRNPFPKLVDAIEKDYANSVSAAQRQYLDGTVIGAEDDIGDAEHQLQYEAMILSRALKAARECEKRWRGFWFWSRQEGAITAPAGAAAREAGRPTGPEYLANYVLSFKSNFHPALLMVSQMAADELLSHLDEVLALDNNVGSSASVPRDETAGLPSPEELMLNLTVLREESSGEQLPHHRSQPLPFDRFVVASQEQRSSGALGDAGARTPPVGWMARFLTKNVDSLSTFLLAAMAHAFGVRYSFLWEYETSISNCRDEEAVIQRVERVQGLQASDPYEVTSPYHTWVLGVLVIPILVHVLKY